MRRTKKSASKCLLKSILKKLKKVVKKTGKTLDKYCEIEYYIQALFECAYGLWPSSSVG